MERDNTKKPGQTREPSSTLERWNYAGARRSEEVVSVRLLRKYAANIDGVSLENAVVGDRLELSRRDADILIAEGWAVPAGQERRVRNLQRRADEERRVRSLPRRALAADSSPASRKKSKK